MTILDSSDSSKCDNNDFYKVSQKSLIDIFDTKKVSHTCHNYEVLIIKIVTNRFHFLTLCDIWDIPDKSVTKKSHFHICNKQRSLKYNKICDNIEDVTLHNCDNIENVTLFKNVTFFWKHNLKLWPKRCDTSWNCDTLWLNEYGNFSSEI